MKIGDQYNAETYTVPISSGKPGCTIATFIVSDPKSMPITLELALVNNDDNIVATRQIIM
jgi:hypothetical protein